MNVDLQTLSSLGSFIDGQWIRNSETPGDDGSVKVVNPATEQCIATLPCLGHEGVISAVEAAERAFETWSVLPAKRRSRALKKWASLIHENIEHLASTLTAEQGKPTAEAKAEVRYGASYIEWYAEEAKRLDGDLIPAPTRDQKLLVEQRAIGVVAAITPWNFPNAMLARKLAPAIAAGCTVVCKPSEETPLSAMALIKLAEIAGIPAGVLNLVISADAEMVGKVLCAHKSVKKLSFTGSTNVGKKLMLQCVATVKKITMELGGNAPFIVFEDADFDAAIEGLLLAKFRNAVQTCISANRVFIHKSIFNEFVAALKNRMKALVVGDGNSDETTIGPLINRRARQKISGLLDDALAKGAEVIYGDRELSGNSNFVTPILLRGVSRDMSIYWEEIFGPVVSLIEFSSEPEVIKLANETDFGLAAYFYSQNYQRVWRVSEKLDFGMIGANEAAISNEMAPFGGVKESGLGREGAAVGIEEYCEHRYVAMGGLKFTE